MTAADESMLTPAVGPLVHPWFGAPADAPAVSTVAPMGRVEVPAGPPPVPAPLLASPRLLVDVPQVPGYVFQVCVEETKAKRAAEPGDGEAVERFHRWEPPTKDRPEALVCSQCDGSHAVAVRLVAEAIAKAKADKAAAEAILGPAVAP